MELFFSQILDGLSIGSVLLLAATGLAIVFGLMGVINLAHGEFMMLGAYVTYVVQSAFKPMGGVIFELYFPISLVLAFVVTGLIGVLLERTLIRKLYGRPLETLLATWGVSLILIQLIRSVSTAMMLGIIVGVVIGFFLSKLLAAKFADRPFFTYLNGLGWAVAIGLGLVAVNLFDQIRPLAKPWFGPRNIDVTAPKWLQGSWGMIGTIELPGLRIFIILLSALLLLATYWFLNKSVWGLRIRAVTQNRQMSNCLGIPTDRVDSITFGIGSGLAGVAGCAITLLGSVGPNLGAAYIVSCFMVIVLGGVGNLLGTVLASLLLGIIQSVIGSGTLLTIFPDMPLVAKGVIEFFATTSMSLVLVFIFIIVFLQFRPNGMFPQKGRSVDAWPTHAKPLRIPVPSPHQEAITVKLFQRLVPWILLAVALFILPAALDDFRLNLFGRYFALSITALAIDLIWGYTGLLSLGQGIFFALGGYAVAMNLMLNTKSLAGGNGIPKFFENYGVAQLPFFWQPFWSPVFTLIALWVIPAAVAGVVGWLIFRNRIKGVYFSIITQAALMVFFHFFNGQQKLFDGTNGLKTSTTELFGQLVGSPDMQVWFYRLTVVLLPLAFLVCRYFTSGRFGDALIGIRDDETRLRFAGFNPVPFKTIVFLVAGALCGISGALYTVQSGIVSPQYMSISFSIEMVIWVAVGGRGTLVGPIIGATLVNYLRSLVSEALPEAWLFVQGALFIFVVVLMPDGIYGWITKGGFRTFLAAFGIAKKAKTYPQLDKEAIPVE